jgi:uncharacterized cupredoxin-like copper-binding protein
MNGLRTVLGIICGCIIAGVSWLGLGSTAIATTATNDLAKQPIVEVKVSLGTPEGGLKFVPDRFEFKSGKRYKLILSNPSPMKHYFTAKDFADGIWSQKVDAGNVEIKGAIHELEIRPGATADWVFVPVRSGNYELHCTIAGHTEAGMKGTIAITSK